MVTGQKSEKNTLPPTWIQPLVDPLLGARLTSSHARRPWGCEGQGGEREDVSCQ